MTTATPIGGSQAAAACGLDPYKSRVALWAEKTGRVEPTIAGESAYWGTQLESLILKETEVRESLKIYSDTGIRAKHPESMSGHLDGIGEDNNGRVFVFEAKTVGLRSAPLWDNNETPTNYIIQVHHYMTLTGSDQALIAALIGGQQFTTRWIQKDPRIEEAMLNLEGEFWEYVQKDTPPPPDGGKATDEVLKRLYPTGGAGIVQLTGDDKVVLDELRVLKESLKVTEAQVSEREQRLKMRLGDCTVGMLDGDVLVRWSNVEARRFDAKRFEEVDPVRFGEFVRLSSYRRLWVRS